MNELSKFSLKLWHCGAMHFYIWFYTSTSKTTAVIILGYLVPKITQFKSHMISGEKFE